MSKSPSPRRKKFRVAALLGSVVAVATSAIALVASVTPTQAANIASQPDTQVAVFMVPLTLLVLVLLVEVARFAWRGTLPNSVPARANKRALLPLPKQDR